jgi:hypothetical protein
MQPDEVFCCRRTGRIARRHLNFGGAGRFTLRQPTERPARNVPRRRQRGFRLPSLDGFDSGLTGHPYPAGDSGVLCCRRRSLAAVLPTTGPRVQLAWILPSCRTVRRDTRALFPSPPPTSSLARTVAELPERMTILIASRRAAPAKRGKSRKSASPPPRSACALPARPRRPLPFTACASRDVKEDLSGDTPRVNGSRPAFFSAS